MNEVRASQWDVTRRLIIMMVFLAVIITWIMIHIVNSSVIHPINKLTSASHNFITCKNIESHCFENLGIRTGDEIEVLADSMEQMEKSLNQNISNLVRVSDELNLTQNMVTKDGLTGIRNKFGYMKEVEKLEEELANGETKFGIVMIDMNYLKKMNDEYGHEKGDIALITVSNIICNVFVHSPVYRYGGDEFVVVLRHNDYDKIEELKTLFEKTIEEQEANESLQPWERVSASLGYALYDPDLDHDVEDVFRRADKAMYDRKVEMKTVRL
jgi:diguanylate cyclase (GGDEF)-like protein